LESHKGRTNKSNAGVVLSRVAPATPAFLILVVVLVVVFAAIYPAFPKVTATVKVQWSDPRLQLTDARLEKMTFAQAASISRGTIFLYAINTQPQTKFTLSVVVSYSGQTLAQGVWSDIPLGLYSFSVVLNPQTEQTNVFYQLSMVASFSDGQSVQIQGIVPPS
jgi:predicted membrane protein